VIDLDTVVGHRSGELKTVLERNMNLRTLMVASVMATGVACGAASAQSAGMYVLHAKASGSCPAMDWHLTLDPSATVNNIKGMIGWDDMKHIARVVGFVNPDTRYFEMEATEVGGPKRTAKIDGQLRLDGWLTAEITGDGIACKNVTIPYYVPPSGGAG
jgi:hypothetical protein